MKRGEESKGRRKEMTQASAFHVCLFPSWGIRSLGKEIIAKFFQDLVHGCDSQRCTLMVEGHLPYEGDLVPRRVDYVKIFIDVYH